MKYTNVSELTLETLIESLESVILACERVDYSLTKEERMNANNSEKTAPYAIGFSRAAVSNVIETLKTLKLESN